MKEVLAAIGIFSKNQSRILGHMHFPIYGINLFNFGIPSDNLPRLG